MIAKIATACMGGQAALPCCRTSGQGLINRFTWQIVEDEQVICPGRLAGGRGDRSCRNLQCAGATNVLERWRTEGGRVQSAEGSPV